MKRLSFFASILAMGVLALAVPFAANASCTNALTFSQGPVGTYCSPGYYCYILSPGLDDIATLQADFWSLNTGDPTVGLGDDDGSRANSDWLQRFQGNPIYGIYMTKANNWSQPGIDGCIENKPARGEERMVALFGDTDAGGTTAYWAVSITQRDTAASPQFDFQGNPPAHIQLIEIPTPAIVASRKLSADVIEVDIQCPDLSAGFYTDGNNVLSDVVQGCQIFQQQLALNSPGPAGAGSRDLANGWAAIGAAIPSGSVGTVTLGGCNATNDFSNYLGVGIALDSGFTTNFVGPNSNRVDCGPNVATPSPRFKLIDKEPKGKGRVGR